MWSLLLLLLLLLLQAARNRDGIDVIRQGLQEMVGSLEEENAHCQYLIIRSISHFSQYHVGCLGAGVKTTTTDKACYN